MGGVGDIKAGIMLRLMRWRVIHVKMEWVDILAMCVALVHLCLGLGLWQATLALIYGVVRLP
jgi:hypothetical protein